MQWANRTNDSSGCKETGEIAQGSSTGSDSVGGAPPSRLARAPTAAPGAGAVPFELNSYVGHYGEEVKQLAIISPAIMGPAYFREAAEAIGAAAGGPPDRAKMTEVFRRHGMTVAAPPPAK